jgi:hypothetical protein
MAISRVAVTVPLLHTQLGYKYVKDGVTYRSGSTDCAVRTCQSAIEFGTWAKDSPAPEDLRPLMGAATTGGTSIRQALRAVRSFGIAPLRYPSRNRGPIQQVKDWLNDGHVVAVYGKYGAVIDGWRPLAGSKTYRGGHAILIFGLEGGQTLDFDPLYDGRRDNIPKGPTLVPFAMIEAFTGSLAGAGRASAYAVPLDAQLLKSQADNEAAAAVITEQSAVIADLQTQLAECRAMLPFPPPAAA